MPPNGKPRAGGTLDTLIAHLYKQDGALEYIVKGINTLTDHVTGGSDPSRGLILKLDRVEQKALEAERQAEANKRAIERAEAKAEQKAKDDALAAKEAEEKKLAELKDSRWWHRVTIGSATAAVIGAVVTMTVAWVQRHFKP